jgi:FkbM family methyltransferase
MHMQRVHEIQRWASKASKARAVLAGRLKGLQTRVTADTSILLPFVAHGHYWPGLHDDAASIAFLKDNLPSGGVYFDIGANVGVYCSALHAMKGGDLRIVAFEPIPTTIAVLQQTLGLNGVPARIEPIALSRGEGELRLTAYPRGLNNFWIKETDSTHPSFSARTRSLYDWLSDHPDLKPDAIKIDVEGHELEVLEGAFPVLSRGRPALMVECHGAAWDELGVSRDRMGALLADAGYRNLRFSDGQAADFANLRTTVHLFATRE